MYMVFSAEDYLTAIRENSPATTKEVAEAVGVTRQGADYRLARLEEDGLVEKQVFGRTYVWTVAEDRERPESESGEPADDSPAAGEPTPEPEQERREPAPEPGPLAEVSFPDSRDRAECLEAIEAARDYIRDHGGASMRELVAEVMSDYPIGYDVPELKEGERYRGAWWRHVVKPGLEALPEIEKPKPGAAEWRYVGED